MNKFFNQALEQSNLSMYRLSKNTGVPYSIINDLAQGKKNINHCEALVVARLAAGLHTTVYEIMNNYQILDKTEGMYRGIRYRWNADSTMILTLRDGKTTTTIDTGYRLDLPGRLTLYQAYTELLINDYLEKKDFDQFVEKWSSQNG